MSGPYCFFHLGFGLTHLFVTSDNLSTLFDGNMKCMGKAIQADGTIVDSVICAKNHLGLRKGISFVNKLSIPNP